MRQYRIYYVGQDGHSSGVAVVDASNDEEAVREAEQASDGRLSELWERGRFIKRFPCEPQFDGGNVAGG
jgi:hypothetical protein